MSAGNLCRYQGVGPKVGARPERQEVQAGDLRKAQEVVPGGCVWIERQGVLAGDLRKDLGVGTEACNLTERTPREGRVPEGTEDLPEAQDLQGVRA